MNGLMKKAGLGVALAVTTLSVAAPADAQRWRRYDRNRGGDVAAGAILGGIVGLGVGAAIASSNRDRFYDDRFYDDRYVYDRRPRFRERYYAPPVRYRVVPRGYYRGYDYPPRYYGGWGY
jgi:opacity protein-like surface antigen